MLKEHQTSNQTSVAASFVPILLTSVVSQHNELINNYLNVFHRFWRAACQNQDENKYVYSIPWIIPICQYSSVLLFMSMNLSQVKNSKSSSSEPGEERKGVHSLRHTQDLYERYNLPADCAFSNKYMVGTLLTPSITWANATSFYRSMAKLQPHLPCPGSYKVNCSQILKPCDLITWNSDLWLK